MRAPSSAPGSLYRIIDPRDPAVLMDNGEPPMERARQSSEGIRWICALALEPGRANGDWKAEGVGLRGEEAKDLKEDGRGERAVMAVVLGASEEESGGETESKRLDVGRPRYEEGADCGAGGSVSVNTGRPCDDCRGKTSAGGATDDEAPEMRGCWGSGEEVDVLGVESVSCSCSCDDVG